MSEFLKLAPMPISLERLDMYRTDAGLGATDLFRDKVDVVGWLTTLRGWELQYVIVCYELHFYPSNVDPV